MILPEWTARKDAGVSPPGRIFFVPFRREERLHRSPDGFSSEDKQAPHMRRVNRSALPPAAGSYCDMIPVFVSTCVRMVSFTEIEAPKNSAIFVLPMKIDDYECCDFRPGLGGAYSYKEE